MFEGRSNAISSALLSACALLSAVLLVPAAAYFPDLSPYPSDTKFLTLGFQGITEIPPGVFARFTALLSL
jgi:hypothetical protein